MKALTGRRLEQHFGEPPLGGSQVALRQPDRACGVQSGRQLARRGTRFQLGQALLHQPLGLRRPAGLEQRPGQMVPAEREVQRTAERADHSEALGEDGDGVGELAPAQPSGRQRIQGIGQPGRMPPRALDGDGVLGEGEGRAMVVLKTGGPRGQRQRRATVLAVLHPLQHPRQQSTRGRQLLLPVLQSGQRERERDMPAVGTRRGVGDGRREVLLLLDEGALCGVGERP